MAEERAIVYKVTYQGVDRIIGSEKAIRDEIKKTKAERDKIASDSKISSSERVKQLDRQNNKLSELQASQVALRKGDRKRKDEALSNSKSLVNEYDRQGAKLRVIRSELKSLSVKRELGLDFDVKRFDDLNKEVAELDGLLKRVDANAGQFQRNVGNYPDVLRGVGTALGALGLGIGFNEILVGLRSGVESTINFSASLSDLSAITGITGDRLKSLEKDINSLTTVQLNSGEQIKTSSSDIAEAYKLIGSAKPELLENEEALKALAKEAIILSKASGDDLATSASNLGEALNFLNIPAEESTRLVNALAAASQKGAKEIPFVNAALAKFGGLASSFKIEPEESIAAIETLGKVIPEASSVGTNLRNVLLVLNKEAQTNGRVFNSISEELGFYGDKVNDAVFLEEKFGKQNLLAAQTLIAQRDSLEELTTSITGTNTAYDQASIKSDNLATDVQNLSKSIQGGLKDLVSARTEGLRPFIRALTELIPKLVKNIDLILKIGLGIGIIAKRALLATTITKVWAASIALINAPLNIYRNRLILATLAQQRFNAATKANVLGAIIVAVTAAYLAYESFADNVDKVSKSQLKLNKTISDTNVELVKEERQVKSLFDVLKSDTASRKEQQGAREDLLRLYPDYLKGINLETASVKQLDDAQNKLVSSIRAATIERRRSEAIGELVDKQIRLERELNDAIKERSNITNDALQDSRFQQDLNNPVRDLQAALGFVKDEIKTINDSFNDAFGEPPEIDDDPVNDFSKLLNEGKEEANLLKKDLDEVIETIESFDEDTQSLQLFERGRKEAEALEELFDKIAKKANSLPDIAPQAGEPESALDPDSDLNNALSKLDIEKSNRLANEVETLEELERLNKEFRAKELQARLDNEIIGKEERLKIEDEIRRINSELDQNEIIRKVDSTLGYIQQGAELFSQFLDNQSQKRIEDNEIKRAEELSQENLTEQQKININSKFDKQREVLEKKAAKKRKAIAVALGVVDAARAGIQAYLSQLIPSDPTSIFRAAIAAATSSGFVLAQTALAATAPGFADGGFATLGTGFISETPNAPRTAKGDNILAYVKNRELILNEPQQNRLASALGTSKRGVAGIAGVKGFADGGFIGGLPSFDVNKFVPTGAIESSVRQSTIKVEIDANKLGEDVARVIQSKLVGLEALGDDVAEKVGESLDNAVAAIEDTLIQKERQG